jgi:hypothetical protein
MRPAIAATFATAILAIAGLAAAKDWAPRTDIEIAALDVRTGALKWTYRASSLGNAHYELYPKLLVAYPHYDPDDRSTPIFLDPATGKPAKDTRAPAALRARSSAQWRKGSVTLSNGWRLDGFSPGNTKTLALVAPGSPKEVWRVEPAHYPELVLGYKDLLLHAYGYLTNEAVIVAHRAAATAPTWSLDFNKLLATPKGSRLGRVSMQILGDVLYAQSGPYVFAIAPETGKVIWQLDAAKAAGLAYEPDIYGGALDLAVFARDAGVLVAAFERRIFAIDDARGRLLWHLQPDTFPHGAFPLAGDGLVYITSGPKRGAAVKAPASP